MITNEFLQDRVMPYFIMFLIATAFVLICMALYVLIKVVKKL
jgi:hypothetical protein